MGNSLVYTHSYTISQLSTTDDGRVIQCEVVINASLSVMANNSITLDVTGEHCTYSYIAMIMFSCIHDCIQQKPASTPGLKPI